MKTRELTQEEFKAAIDSKEAVEAIRALFKFPQGRTLFKFLFKYLRVGELPIQGLEGTYLADELGMLRAGKSVFEIACMADSQMAADILATLEKERYHERYIQKFGTDDEDGTGNG